jgi:adenylate cyclase class IV
MSKTKAQHRELEVKLAADGMNIKAFKDWCFGRDPSKYLHVTGPDVYYTQGKNVLRHRQPGQGGPGELTVKRRTSKKSTRDRLEIDLKFADIVNIEDVGRFLTATGWKQKFTVIKDCHIFWFEDRVPASRPCSTASAACCRTARRRGKGRFVEFEIHKADSHHAHGR